MANVYGVGVYERGAHVAYSGSKPTKLYNLWHDMLRRCYSEKYHEKFPTYVGCSVCEEWRNFQTFASWAVQQVGYNCEGFQLDKDLVIKGNKIYGTKSCVFVPSEVNMFLTNCKSVRGGCPVGVYWKKKNSKYVALLRVGTSERQHLGYFTTQQEAFSAYKAGKERHAKSLASKYIGVCDQRIIDALNNYQVDATD